MANPALLSPERYPNLIGWLSEPAEHCLLTETDRRVYAASKLATESFISAAFGDDLSLKTPFPSFLSDDYMFGTDPKFNAFLWKGIAVSRGAKAQTVDRIHHNLTVGAVAYSDLVPSTFEALGSPLVEGHQLPPAAVHLHTSVMAQPSQRGELYLPPDRRVSLFWS